MRLVFDAESDNLLEEATIVWCITTKDINTKEMLSFLPNEIDKALSYISKAEELVGHNIISFDLPLFEKLYNFKYDGIITDTLVMSRVQYPDRPLPKGYRGRASHSLDAWGYRVNRGKVEYNDWSKFSDEMLYRNVEDVEINELVYYALLEEQKR